MPRAAAVSTVTGSYRHTTMSYLFIVNPEVVGVVLLFTLCCLFFCKVIFSVYIDGNLFSVSVCCEHNSQLFARWCEKGAKRLQHTRKMLKFDVKAKKRPDLVAARTIFHVTQKVVAERPL